MSSIAARRPILERQIALRRELLRRQARERHAQPGGLHEFVRYFWHILEPKTRFVDGWAIRAICEHLEAVTDGRITRLLINVPPGFSKSLISNVFWPAWEWSAKGLSHYRFVAFSYGSHLTERDNQKFRSLILSRDFTDLYGDVFATVGVGVVKIANDKTGWKFASSALGIGTGERGDRIVADDLHKADDGELVRNRTVRWFDEAMSSRLNDMNRSAIVVIGQRVHEDDVSGFIVEKRMQYCHLLIPMQYDGERPPTEIGWVDPRRTVGELAWPERYDLVNLADQYNNEFVWASQYQQTPEPRGGGIFKRKYWRKLDIPLGRSPPPMEYVVASLDSAYDENEHNDPSGFTAWGIYRDANGNPQVLMLAAWRKHLEIHGPHVDRLVGESERSWVDRAKKEWGLVEWVEYECKRLRVDRLLVENKASGKTVAQEIQRIYRSEGFGVELVNPLGDKFARALAVIHLWTDGFVHVPASYADPKNSDNDPDVDLMPRDWAELAIDDHAKFPNGRYRDVVDSATQALYHLRMIGLAVRREERHDEVIARSMHREKVAPLYPV